MFNLLAILPVFPISDTRFSLPNHGRCNIYAIKADRDQSREGRVIRVIRRRENRVTLCMEPERVSTRPNYAKE